MTEELVWVRSSSSHDPIRTYHKTPECHALRLANSVRQKDHAVFNYSLEPCRRNECFGGTGGPE